MNRKNTAQALLLSEVIALQRAASSPEGIHGYGLRDLFGDEEIRSGTVYRRLGILAKNGYLAAAVETNESSQAHSGPARKLYSITDRGRVILEEALNMIGATVTNPEVTTAPTISAAEQAALGAALPVIQRLAGSAAPGS